MSNVDYPYRDGTNMQLGPGTLLTADGDIYSNGTKYVPATRYDALRDEMEDAEASRPDWLDREARQQAVAVSGGDISKAREAYAFLIEKAEK